MDSTIQSIIEVSFATGDMGRALYLSLLSHA